MTTIEQVVRAAVAATLRQIAPWCEEDVVLRDMADAVERGRGPVAGVCPVCESRPCAPTCPLAGINAGSVTDERVGEP